MGYLFALYVHPGIYAICLLVHLVAISLTELKVTVEGWEDDSQVMCLDPQNPCKSVQVWQPAWDPSAPGVRDEESPKQAG